MARVPGIISVVEQLVGDPINSPWFWIKCTAWGGAVAMVLVVANAVLH